MQIKYVKVYGNFIEKIMRDCKNLVAIIKGDLKWIEKSDIIIIEITKLALNGILQVFKQNFSAMEWNTIQ